MSRAELPAVVRDLIAEHTPTMDHVAALLYLRGAPGTAHPVADVAAGARLDPALAERVLRELAASRIVAHHPEGYQYAPAGSLGSVVDALADLYHTKPVSLVRAIYDRPARAAQTFADAFRIRNGEP